MMINTPFFYITIVYKSLLIVLGTLPVNTLPERYSWLWKVSQCGQQVAHIAWIKLRFTHTYHSQYFYGCSIYMQNQFYIHSAGCPASPASGSPLDNPRSEVFVAKMDCYYLSLLMIKNQRVIKCQN